MQVVNNQGLNKVLPKNKYESWVEVLLALVFFGLIWLFGYAFINNEEMKAENFHKKLEHLCERIAEDLPYSSRLYDKCMYEAGATFGS